MLDDETGEPLMQRPDDTAAALVTRLKSYHAETTPLLDHYAPKGCVHKINGAQQPPEVWKEIEAILPKNKAMA